MAQNVFFKKGLLANLPESYSAGTFYVTTDERAMYLDIDDSTRIRLGDFIQVAAVANLPTAGASTSALYYCVAENILAKWNGEDWTQINKQPTAEEMKTLLGLGTMAYKSTVGESDISTDLAKKINDASAANHGHDNKDVIDGITAEKVAAWDAAEKNAKDHADGLNTAMNTRVEALEAIDHEHANKALLDTYTQTEADLADAVAKKHEHANAAELAKIVDGDKAKWDAVAADHLTSADKTTLENSIKDAKKAGTDANTNIETYKVSNDARVKAVEDDVAEIVDGTNGILAQAKSYTDGKDSAMNTRVAALETAAPTHALKTEVEAVDAKFANYNTTVAQKAIDDAQDAEIAKKVNKTDYEADKATFATKTELGDVDAKFANYKTAADQKLVDDAQDVEIGKKVDKVDGKDLIATSEIERLATLKNYDDTALAGRVTTAEGKITALEGASATHATKEEAQGYADAKDEAIAAAQKTADDLATYVGTFTASEGVDTVVKYIDAKTANIASDERVNGIDNRVKAIEGDYLVAADIADFETKENVKKVADDLAEYVESNNEALAGVKATAEAARTEDEVNSQIDAKITALNLGTTYEPIGAEDRAKAYVDGKFTDANLAQYTTEQEVKDIVDGVIAGAADSETYNSLTKLVDYIDAHGGEASEMAQAIEALEGDVKGLKEAPSAGIKATDVEAWNGEIGAKALAETKLDASAFAEYSNAHAGDYTNKQIDDAIDADVKAAIDAEVLRANGAYDSKGAASDAQAAAIADAAGKYETKGTAQGIVDGLKLSETYEPIGAEGRAIAAAKAETETQVKALAGEGNTSTVKKNADDIASLFEQMQWGSF